MKRKASVGRTPARNMPHCNPKWLRKQRRIELEGEAREYEIKAEHELTFGEEVEEAVKKAKRAAAESLLNIAGRLRSQAKFLKGLMPRKSRARG